MLELVIHIQSLLEDTYHQRIVGWKFIFLILIVWIGDFILCLELLLFRNILNNTVDNKQPCLIPTSVGKGRPIWLFNRMLLIVELYIDFMMLISTMCILIVVMTCHT